MSLLLEFPAELAAFEINAWTRAQFRGNMGAVPVSDYLYHAVDKIFQISARTASSRRSGCASTSTS